jgi:hypothetical protein
MINDTGIEGEIYKGLWAECTSTATYLENKTFSKEINSRH